MDFEVNGRNYRASKMDAMTQFNVIRKLAPIMEPLAEFISTPRGGNGGQANAVHMAMPIIKAISELPEETTDYVIEMCMSRVRRDEGEGRGWAKIWNDQARRPQMDDIDMVTMLMIVVQVLGGSFSAFFPESDLPSGSPLGSRSNLTQ
jgi:hypothetical protein